MKTSPTVERVLRGQLCTGCGACASADSAPFEMIDEAPGYARPRQRAPVTAEAERLIAAACPGAVVEPWASDVKTHPSWGPWREVMTAHAADPVVRYEASSGGALSALLIHALAIGLVDRVLHVEADPDRPTRNIMRVSTSAAEVLAGAGSRYTASSPLAGIDAMLAQGGAFAFVGKPCDVSALRGFGKVDPRVGRHVPIALSFFCGGMPSHNGVERILKTMGTQSPEVVAFRYRGQGWPGFAAATTRAGEVLKMTYAQSWGDHLSKEVQFRCKICPDAVGGVADLACADAWYGGESGYPSFDEEEGRSLVMARSEAGRRLLRSAMEAGVVIASPLEVGEIDLMQPAQARRKRLVAARLAALIVTGQPRPRMGGTLVMQAARTARLSEALRNFAGTLRRILSGRR